MIDHEHRKVGDKHSLSNLSQNTKIPELYNLTVKSLIIIAVV